MSDTSSSLQTVESPGVIESIRYCENEIAVILGHEANIDAAIAVLAKIIPGKSIAITQNAGVTRSTSGDRGWKSSEPRWQISVIAPSIVSGSRLYQASNLPRALILAILGEQEGA